jgi:hypothetical protein
MTVTVLIYRNCKSLAALMEAISIVNQTQPYFRLHLSRVNWLPNDTKRRVSGGTTKKLIRKKYAKRPVLAVIQNPMRGGWFEFPSKDVWIVSTAQWNEHFAPPPLKVYLIYEFACALAAFVGDLSDEQIGAMWHKQLRGCVFDQSSGRKQLRLDLVAAHLCAECEARLSEMGVADQPIEAIFDMLAFVRQFAIRRPRSTPSHVFVGHGRSDDWRKLEAFLTGQFGLKIEEFNRDPAAGVPTTERLSEMLNKTCFALLVMTAEDVHYDGKIHARENVVHEIGLFQGRLGFRKSIIVKQNGTTEFSNIAGLTYIPYPKGRIEEAFPGIMKTLIREGVLDSRIEKRLPEDRRAQLAAPGHLR